VYHLKFMAGTLAACLLLTTAPSAAADTPGARLQREINALIEALRAQVSQLKAANTAMREQIAAPNPGSGQIMVARAPQADTRFKKLFDDTQVATAIYDNFEENLKRLGTASVDYAKVIYAHDDRTNYRDAASYEKSGADATAALVKADRLIKIAGRDAYNLPDRKAGLCRPREAQRLGYQNERFYDEPAPAHCSGFKVGERLIATASHCIKTETDCTNTRFVFGFRIDGDNLDPHLNIEASRVFTCKKIVGHKLEGNGPDWSIVEVDRDMQNIPTVKMRPTGNAGTDVKLTVIGYPMGLPVKIAANGVIRSVKNGYYVANVDTYGGNSGSVVFNTEQLQQGNLLAEGILVRGENDFEVTTPCRISKRCGVDGCRGEDITMASEFRDLL